MHTQNRLLRAAAVAILCAVFYALGQINARVIATQNQLQSAFGTAKVKLVFSCQSSLYFVDFSEAAPQIRKMNNIASAYYPVISMDGQWLTYQTDNAFEGPSTNPPAKVWLRELAADGTPIKITDTGYVPRFALNTPSDTPEIIYSTSLACPRVNGISICYNAGMTMKTKIINKTPQSSEVVFDSGSYYGGLSWDNRYLFTGWPSGPNAFMLDLQNSAGGPHAIHSMHVRKNSTNADTFVAIGSCNISRSASRYFTNTMLYYDFSSSAITSAKCYHPILGTWKQHEKLFISRFDGEDLKVFDMPADRPIVPLADALGLGEAVGKEWENPEWSNHPYFAVASLMVDRLWLVSGGVSWDHTYNNELIYLVGLKDSSYIKLIESTDTSRASKTSFFYPFVWVEIPASGFVEDSTWLKETIWEKAGIGVINPFQTHRPFFLKNAFLFDKKITGMVVYSIQGKKIAERKPSGKTGIDAEKILRKLKSGIYFISIETRGKKQQIIRWIVTR